MTKKYLLAILIISKLSVALFISLGFSMAWFFSYLSVNKPLSPEILVVEGWVSESTIQLAAKEFNERSYAQILCSGSPTDPFYLLSENGHLEFSFSDQELSLQKNDTISFLLKGSPVQGTYPEYMIAVNDKQLSKGSVSETEERYSLILDSAFIAQKISIYFLNDTHHMGEDRNLELGYLCINGIEYLARSSRVLHYDQKDHQRLSPRTTNYFSVAEICANKLQKEGIPNHLIKVVPSPIANKNRTLASAIVISEYLEGQHLPYSKLNIISEGIHARRTWLAYKFAFRKQINAPGIICIPPVLNNHSGIQSFSNKEILKELASIIYYKLFFNKTRYRKALIQDYPSFGNSF